MTMAKPLMVIAGASGVVGRHLIAAAKTRYDLRVLTRSVQGDEPEGVQAVRWRPAAFKEGNDDALETLAEQLSGAQVLVNLAGASIAAGRLGKAHRRRVLESRVDSTATLVAAFRRAATPPPVWLQASAIHYYGNRGDELLTEDAGPQDSFFLSDVCQAWEAAAQTVAGETRQVTGRFGLVLAKDAEAWQKLLLPIRLFVGGPLGSGRQWYAWLHAEDLAQALLFLAEDPRAEGAYNLCTPEPVRQATLARAAAARLARPAALPVPAFALQLAVGGVADALLLPSSRVIPARLEQAGFRFKYPTLADALESLLD